MYTKDKRTIDLMSVEQTRQLEMVREYSVNNQESSAVER